MKETTGKATGIEGTDQMKGGRGIGRKKNKEKGRGHTGPSKLKAWGGGTGGEKRSFTEVM